MKEEPYKSKKGLSEKEFLEFINNEVNEKQLASNLHGFFYSMRSAYSMEQTVKVINENFNKIVSCLGIQNISAFIRPQNVERDDVFAHTMLQFEIQGKQYVIYFDKNSTGNWFFVCETEQTDTYYHYSFKVGF